MRVYLVRHGETELNRLRRVQGHNDEPLNDTGRAQAVALGRAFEPREVHAVWHSPLSRARQTAELAFGNRGLPLHPDARLMELGQGVLEGLSFADLAQQHADEVRAWRADPVGRALPGGESFGALADRAWLAWEAICADAGERPVAVVTHNFTIMALVLRFLGAPLHAFERIRLHPASVTVIETAFAGPALASLNDTRHLDGLAPVP